VDAAKLSVYIRRIFSSLEIEDASFHTLRHTAASWMVQAGVSLYSTGQVFGHKTPRMTQRYAHLAPEHRAAAAGKLSEAMMKALPGHLRWSRLRVKRWSNRGDWFTSSAFLSSP
jgi:Phage integrase family